MESAIVPMTKKQAAAEQIDQAIRLWREGFIASAVTLAGAAEGSMPEPQGGTLFGWLKVAGIEALQLPEKQVVAQSLNHVRDWLKHDGLGHEREVTPLEGFFMLARAYSKFIMVYGQDAQTDIMRGMIEEIGNSIRQLVQPFVDALTKLGSISHSAPRP